MKQYQPEAPSGKGEMEKEIQKEGQQSPPKKRQRTIFEFAGMRIQDKPDRPSQIEAMETSGEHMESNITDGDKIARTAQQLEPSTPKMHTEEDMLCQDSPAPDKVQPTKQ